MCKGAIQSGKAVDSTAVASLFDMAEAMENGGGRGLVWDMARPAQLGCLSAGQQLTLVNCDAFQIVRGGGESSVTGACKLVNAAGETLLIAKPAGSGSNAFHIFASRTSRGPLSPKALFSKSFVLHPCGRDYREWVLTSTCERCAMRGRRRCGNAPMARFLRGGDSPGVGRTAAKGVAVELPAVTLDGDRACTCDVCGDSAAPWVAEVSARQTGIAKTSAKGAWLECASTSTGEPCLSIRKVDEARSALEYHAPLGIVHALAAAIVGMVA